MTRRPRSGTTDPSASEKTPLPGRPLDEAEAILRDVEGEAALQELWAIAARNRRLAARSHRLRPDEQREPTSSEQAQATLQARLQGLARFASIFTAPDFQFATWRRPPPEPSGILNLPYCELSNEANAFVRAAYELGWVKTFNWSRWADTPKARELMNSPECVAEATPEQLAKLLTAHIRGDRFNEGLLNSAFETGLLTAIVKRAEALLRTPCSTAVAGASNAS